MAAGADDGGYDVDGLAAGPDDFIFEEHAGQANEGGAGDGGDGEHEADGDFPRPPDPYDVNCCTSIYVPGMLHIVSNITRDLSAHLEWCSQFLAYLTHICRMLSRSWTRKRFKETCLRAPHAFQHFGFFDGFNTHVQEGRWGTVVHAVGDLLPGEQILRQFWSLAAYNQAGGLREDGNDGEGEGHGVRMHVVDEGINSPLFWVYCFMIDTVGEFLEHLSNLSETCPCHRGALRLRGLARHARRQQLQQDTSQKTCPLAGMMAPEFAAGEHIRITRGLAQTSQGPEVPSPCMQAFWHYAPMIARLY
ncbi:unnamed protein product [Prorocentrum cordatum]|uniref:Uncharacterized protein n=1 Tax=Prorocentrum cordatum TaxID=2364126 RepID=A0ABN9UIU4_9DINO|nr:unnamed protein product [Polarella glacialis]